MAIKVNETMLRLAEEAAFAGDTARAWDLLSIAGDRYAGSAQVIIEEINNPSSVFAKIV
jgi:hypothetical protein